MGHGTASAAVAQRGSLPTRCWREQDSNHRFRGGRARRFVCRFSFAPTFREPTRGDLKDWSCHAGPMVRILFPPAASLERTVRLPSRPLVRAQIPAL